MPKITVTGEDIENGRQNDPQSCPIALAATRQFSQYVKVYNQELHIIPDIKVYIFPKVYTLPKEAQQFIKDFDRNMPVKPFSFRITRAD